MQSTTNPGQQASKVAQPPSSTQNKSQIAPAAVVKDSTALAARPTGDAPVDLFSSALTDTSFFAPLFNPFQQMSSQLEQARALVPKIAV
jgi:hypothetical protein